MKPEVLHKAARDAMRRQGLPRTEAFYRVADDLRVRPGVVAAAYWRVERLMKEAPARAAAPGAQEAHDNRRRTP